VAVDEGSEIIRTAILTSADLHDSQPAAQLICGDERAVYGDKAYASQALSTFGFAHASVKRGKVATAIFRPHSQRERLVIDSSSLINILTMARRDNP
jgi:hypothetical protein